ncbi:prolyl oligopeptidase family serine peptidase [Rhodococcus hoagii]|nr:prolyl oligopeptidase family serine peptidase [Prescottella equi]
MVPRRTGTAGAPGYSDYFPALGQAGITVFAPNVRGSGGFGRTFVPRRRAVRPVRRYRRRGGLRALRRRQTVARPARIACAGHSYGGYLTLAALTFQPRPVRDGHRGLRDEQSRDVLRQHRAVDRGRGVHQVRASGTRSGTARRAVTIHRVDALTAPVLVVHGAPRRERSGQRVGAGGGIVRARGGVAELLLFDDEGHDIVKRENRDALAEKMVTG